MAIQVNSKCDLIRIIGRLYLLLDNFIDKQNQKRSSFCLCRLREFDPLSTSDVSQVVVHGESPHHHHDHAHPHTEGGQGDRYQGVRGGEGLGSQVTPI